MYTHAVVTRAHVGKIHTVKAQRLVKEIDKLLPLLEPLLEKQAVAHTSLNPSETEAVHAMTHLLRLSHDQKIMQQLQQDGNTSVPGTLSASLVAVLPEMRAALHDQSLVDGIADVAQRATDLPDSLLKHL